MGVSAVRIQDKDNGKRVSVVESTAVPGKYGIVLVNPDGSKIETKDGEDGVGISNITSETVGNVTTITIYLTDGTSYSFDIEGGGGGGGGGGEGDMKYSDFYFVSKEGNNFILSFSSKITPASNFTVNAPNAIKDGQVYVLRVNNGETAYTMSLGTNILNYQGTDLTLTPNAVDMFVFLAVDGNLELQKEMYQGGDVNDGVLTIQKNSTNVGTFTANQSTNSTINIVVPTTASDINALPNTTKYGASLVASINSSTYVITLTLKDQDGGTLGTAQTIDLPLESVVVNGSYNDSTKKIVLTLQNGNTVEFSVADLVAGLQTEITSTNKLSSDLVDDSGHTNKFVTASDISNWNAKAGPNDVNTKTFYLSSTSDLTNAQAAYDWYLAGKNPVVVYSNKAYTLYNKTSTSLTFACGLDVGLSGSVHHIANSTLSFTLSSNTVTAVGTGYVPSSDYFLKTNYNYSTPYTPAYDGSPATKKYVDDNNHFGGFYEENDSLPAGQTTDNKVYIIYEDDGNNS